MPERDFDAFVADIEKHGVREPVVIYDDMILDGRHRWRACERLGIVVPTVRFTGSAEDAERLAESLNRHRRHMTIAQRRELIMQELKRNPTQSDRSIARKVNVTADTVGSVRAKLEDSGTVSKVDTRIGSDGVTQPAKRTNGAGHAPRETTKRPVRQRIEEMRALAAAGHSTHQIADAQGIGLEYANMLMTKNNISVCVPRRGRPIDGARVVRESVSTLSGVAHGLRLAGDFALDADEASAIRIELREALRQIRMLDLKLKEIAHHG